MISREDQDMQGITMSPEGDKPAETAHTIYPAYAESQIQLRIGLHDH